MDDVRIYEEFDEPASFFDSFARVGDSCSSETSQCDIKTLRPHLLPLYSNAFHASNERIAEFVQPLYFRIRSSGIVRILRKSIFSLCIVAVYCGLFPLVVILYRPYTDMCYWWREKRMREISVNFYVIYRFRSFYFFFLFSFSLFFFCLLFCLS